VRLTDDQVCFVARTERAYGQAKVVPPGPLRDRLLADAGDGAVAVTVHREHMYPIGFAVERDGEYDQVAGTVL
jgi:hypothetical protein